MIGKSISWLGGSNMVHHAKILLIVCLIVVSVFIVSQTALRNFSLCFDRWSRSSQISGNNGNRSSQIRTNEPYSLGPRYFVDAALACENEATHGWLTKELLKLNQSCPVKTYLQVQKNGQFRKSSGTSGVLGNASCPRNPIVSPYKNLPCTGLISWPGSGNTWTRHLLQQLTGIQTGSVYNDQSLKHGGFPGEGLTTGVIAIKSHYVPLKLKFDKMIILIRNPFNAFLAEYRRREKGHVGQLYISKGDRTFSRYLLTANSKWAHYVKALLISEARLLIVLYEDLQSCLMRELLRIGNFLQTPQLTKFSVCCAMGNVEGRHHRNQTDPPITSLIKEDVRQTINLMLTRLSKDLAKGFPILSKRILTYRL